MSVRDRSRLAVLLSQLLADGEFEVDVHDRLPPDWAEFGIVGGPPGPVMLLPLDSPRSAAASLRRRSNATPPIERIARDAGAAVLRTGAGRTLLHRRIAVRRTGGDAAGPSLHEWLAATYGLPNVEIAVTFGPLRPNQKPVVRVMSAEGTTIGFAKVGWNEATRALVEHEANFLRALPKRAMAGIEAPRLVRLGSRSAFSIAALAPLTATTSRRHPPTAAAFREVADLGPTSRSQLETSEYVHVLLARIDLLDAAERSRATGALEAVIETCGTNGHEYGRWHGDWTPWNTGWTRRGLAVWDWERTSTPVPVGFDALHYWFQPRFRRGRRLSFDDIEMTLNQAAPALGQLGVAEPQRCGLAALYLLELFTRFALQQPFAAETRARLIGRLGDALVLVISRLG